MFRAVALVGVAVLCTVVSFVMMHDQGALDRHGAVAVTRVVRVHVIHNPRSTDRYLDVAIPGLPGSYQVSEYDSDVRAGDLLKLRYLPTDPTVNEEEGHDISHLAWIVWLIALAAAALAVVDLREGARTRRRPHRIDPRVRRSIAPRGRHQTERHHV
ncbi:hypothetical protein ACFT5B_16615 [Luteimicrobium sp. NPDC057192]|uniref:hypothetical protein n=1 Tax=Luteimicrobium sp. NPDC057192 TaxID=3346042 RepID=UPI003644A891